MSRAHVDNPITSRPPSHAYSIIEALVGVLESIEHAIAGEAIEAGVKTSIRAREPITLRSLHWPPSTSVHVSRRREDYKRAVYTVVTRNPKAFTFGSSVVDLVAVRGIADSPELDALIARVGAREEAVVKAGHWAWVGRLAPENSIAQSVGAVVFTLHVSATGNLHGKPIFQILRIEDVRLHKLHRDVEKLLKCADWRARSVGVDQFDLLLV